MYKAAGTVKYPWIAVSPSDPTKAGLGYMTEMDATNHADSMNSSLERYDTDPIWNKDFWKSKPESWVVIHIPG